MPGFGSYWKLKSYGNMSGPELKAELRKAGQRGICDARKLELVRHQHKIDRGLIVYDSCTDEELDKFVRNRRLASTITTRITAKLRGENIKLLERADETLRFKKFVDLPAELRTRIYEIYMEHFDTVLSTPIQPPLARVSRMLRQEVLPVFYSRHVFRLEYWIDHDHKHLGFRPSKDTSLFLHSLVPGLVAYCRKFQLVPMANCHTSRIGRKVPKWLCACNVGLINVGAGFHVTINIEPCKRPLLPWRQSAVDGLHLELSQLLENVPKQDGMKRSRMEDLHAFRTAVEKGLRSVFSPILRGQYKKLPGADMGPHERLTNLIWIPSGEFYFVDGGV